MNDRISNIPPPIDGAAALAVTLNWLRTLNWTEDFRDFVMEPLDVSSAPETLAEHLAAANLRNWRDVIIAASSERTLHLQSSLRWLMGQTALEIAVGIYQPGTFFAVEKLKTLAGMSNAELASAVCDRITDVSVTHSILGHLHTRLQTLWKAPFNERMRQYAESSSISPLRSRDIWPRRDGMPLGDGWAHQIVAHLSPEHYTEMLASFPAQFQLGFGDVLSPPNFGLVASLVRASPITFSDDGVLFGPVVVFMLLDAIENHLAMINAEELATAEIGLGSILDAIQSRSDGNWINRAWLQQIIWRDTPRRAGRYEADMDAQRNVRYWLIAQLSAHTQPDVRLGQSRRTTLASQSSFVRGLDSRGPWQYGRGSGSSC